MTPANPLSLRLGSNAKLKMENEEKPKPKVAQLFASFSSFSIGRQTFGPA